MGNGIGFEIGVDMDCVDVDDRFAIRIEFDDFALSMELLGLDVCLDFEVASGFVFLDKTDFFNAAKELDLVDLRPITFLNVKLLSQLDMV